MALIESVRPPVERWRSQRWWRSVSPALRPSATNVAEHVQTTLSDLDAAWEQRCTETSELVTGFVAALEPDQLGPSDNERFLQIAEKHRWRELRALLVSHLATEIVTRMEVAARPLLDELERIQLFGHRPALMAGDLPDFHRTCMSLAPEMVIPGAYETLVKAIDARSADTVDAYLQIHEIPSVDGELRTLLESDVEASAHRLVRALSLRATPQSRVVVDLVGVEPMIELADHHEPVDMGVPPWTGPDAAHG